MSKLSNSPWIGIGSIWSPDRLQVEQRESNKTKQRYTFEWIWDVQQHRQFKNEVLDDVISTVLNSIACKSGMQSSVVITATAIEPAHTWKKTRYQMVGNKQSYTIWNKNIAGWQESEHEIRSVIWMSVVQCKLSTSSPKNATRSIYLLVPGLLSIKTKMATQVDSLFAMA